MRAGGFEFQISQRLVTDSVSLAHRLERRRTGLPPTTFLLALLGKSSSGRNLGKRIRCLSRKIAEADDLIRFQGFNPESESPSMMERKTGYGHLVIVSMLLTGLTVGWLYRSISKPFDRELGSIRGNRTSRSGWRSLDSTQETSLRAYSSFLFKPPAHRLVNVRILYDEGLRILSQWRGCLVSKGNFFAACYMIVKAGFSRARKHPILRGGQIKLIPDLPNSRPFSHTHLCLRSYWVPGRRLCQSSLDIFTRTSISGSVRRAVTYLSMDFGDFNFSSCEYHPYSQQYPISVALRFHP